MYCSTRNVGPMAEYFAGGWSGALTCRVEAGPDDLIELITALVDKSILIREQTDSTVRFRMLETLRVYGHEQLARTGEYPDLAWRHAIEHLATRKALLVLDRRRCVLQPAQTAIGTRSMGTAIADLVTRAGHNA